MKLWKKKLTPKQVRHLLYRLELEISDSTIYRHSKKFNWELTNNKSYDLYKEDCFTIIVLKNGKYFEAITNEFAEEVLSK